jgi:hypothetical protein
VHKRPGPAGGRLEPVRGEELGDALGVPRWGGERAERQREGVYALVQQQMAAGMLSGGAATEASRIMSAQQAAGAAQTERDIQGRSNQLAQQQYLMDLARIDAEAARSLAASQRTGEQLRESGDLSQLGIPSQSAVEKAATKAPPPASVVKGP